MLVWDIWDRLWAPMCAVPSVSPFHLPAWNSLVSCGILGSLWCPGQEGGLKCPGADTVQAAHLVLLRDELRVTVTLGLEPRSCRVRGTFFRFLCGALEILVVSPNLFLSLSPVFAVSHFWRCFPMWLGVYLQLYSCNVPSGLMLLGPPGSSAFGLVCRNP